MREDIITIGGRHRGAGRGGPRPAPLRHRAAATGLARSAQWPMASGSGRGGAGGQVVIEAREIVVSGQGTPPHEAPRKEATYPLSVVLRQNCGRLKYALW